ncbi:type II secretion system secretin GspD [Methylibium rhizosphaerae]|uniref:type II secretion system secretin GspD n=1 Tax=Methylibium rhizosphaerae TaxID=2570323 RepID=UPI003CCC516A
MRITSLQSPRRATTLCTRALTALLAVCLAAPAPLVAQQPAKRSEPVTLNFVNADIEGVTRAMGAILDRQILVDPRVKGTITLYSEQPLSPREAFLNYQAALRGLGFAIIEVAGLLKVVPEADAKLQTGTVSVGAVTQRGDQIITQIFRLQHENANNLVAILRPLISPNNTINANPGNNSLVITDYADNLARIAKIIAATDVPAATDLEVIPLQHAAASDLAALVQRLADTSGAPAIQGAPGGGALTVLADPRTNSLLVRSPNQARLSLVKSVVEKLDRPGQGGIAGSNIHVVYLKNADAVKLAQVLRASFGGGSGGGSGSDTGGGSLGSNTALGRGGQQPGTTLGNTGQQQQAGGAASPQATAPVQQSGQPSTGGFIQADPASNSLIITATEPVYRQLRAVIDQLDSRRAQVYIESLIVEVTGNNAAEIGIQWQGLLGREGDKYGLVGGTNFGGAGNLLNITGQLISGASSGSTGTTPSSLLGNGLNIGLIKDFGGTYGLAALMRLLQSQSNINIQSTPNLITLDNEEAKIVVGRNVPFVTGQFTSTGTGTTSPFQTIERQDVGITLRIKPQIGESGTVRMQIFQESSQVEDQVAPGTSNAGPSTSKRSIESNVVVDDGQIIVLGGLIEDSLRDVRSKVPLLGDIPVLGALFRSESRTKERRNLMVFLRPVVMRDQAAANKLTLDRYDVIRAQQQANQPEHRLLLPINEAPVLPPLQTPAPAQPAAKQEPPPPIAPSASAPLR